MTTKIKERIKSIVLVVLFLLTILLLYLVFVHDKDMNISNLLPNKKEEVIQTFLAEDVVFPQTVIYSTSSSNRIKCDNNKELFEKFCTYFKDFSDLGTSMVSEISKEQVDSATTDFASLQFHFRYSVPFVEFCSKHDINRTSGYSTIKYVTSFIISDAASSSIIVHDNINGKYYRIMSESSKVWTDEFNVAALTGDSVYRANQVLGVNSDVYIPVLVQRKVESLAFVYEQFQEGTNALKNVASYIFGEALGFVRKINDSFGNLTYMYGYGEKTVNVQADGTLEYKNSAVQPGNSKGFYGDLQTAISFAENCGGWGSDDRHPVFKLVDVSITGSDKNASYTFFFNQALDGEEIVDEKPALKITVENGQVSNYVRHAVYAISSYEEKADVQEAANAIAVIADKVYKKYLDEVGASDTLIEENSAYTYTAYQISRIRTCYKPKEGSLIPSWCIEFKDGSKQWIGLKQKQF